MPFLILKSFNFKFADNLEFKNEVSLIYRGPSFEEGMEIGVLKEKEENSGPNRARFLAPDLLDFTFQLNNISTQNYINVAGEAGVAELGLRKT